jgi:hypothetical protein
VSRDREGAEALGISTPSLSQLAKMALLLIRFLPGPTFGPGQVLGQYVGGGHPEVTDLTWVEIQEAGDLGLGDAQVIVHLKNLPLRLGQGSCSFVKLRPLGKTFGVMGLVGRLCKPVIGRGKRGLSQANGLPVPPAPVALGQVE